jgi:hypothetical protein
MINNNTKTILSTALPGILLLVLVFGLVACEAMPKSDQAKDETAAATKTEQSQEASTETAPADTTTSEAVDAGAEAAAESQPEMEKPMAPTIVESCKDEPYVDYEKQARASIANGLAATNAGTYGVGFRDLDEHKKWAGIHNQLFTQVNNSCQALSDCAKNNPKDKEAKCADQAKNFSAWQELAADFAKKAKLSETTQPPIICSFEPSLDDPQRCFHQRAAKIDESCDNDACKAVSNCWRGVGFLDAAIAQAKRSCGFVNQALDQCRGYVEAKGRRVKKYEQCQTMQDELNLAVMPVL